MTLSIGDHLVIKRGGRALGPEDEAYHEYEVIAGRTRDNMIDDLVITYLNDPLSPYPSQAKTEVILRVVE